MYHIHFCEVSLIPSTTQFYFALVSKFHGLSKRSSQLVLCRCTDLSDLHHGCPIEISAPFAVMLLSHYVAPLNLYQLVINWGWEWGGTRFDRANRVFAAVRRFVPPAGCTVRCILPHCKDQVSSVFAADHRFVPPAGCTVRCILPYCKCYRPPAKK